MKEIKKYLIVAVISIIISVSTVLIHSFLRKDKIGMVRTGILLEQSNGIKKANEILSAEVQTVQANIDTLRKRYEQLNILYQTEGGKRDKLLQYKVETARDEFYKYNEKATAQMEQRKNEIINAELKNINQLIENYGKKHGYKLILGSTSEGSILYGDTNDDITEEILDIINKETNQK